MSPAPSADEDAAPLRFQAMSESTLGEVAAAEREIYEFPWTRGNFRDSMAAGYACLELRDAAAGALLGYAVMMSGAGDAHLLNLSVVKGRQGHGYGAALLALMVERARAGGADRLLLEVRPSNAVAQRLYERAGFRRAGIRRGYYPARGGREDAILLDLDLTAAPPDALRIGRC